MPNFFSRGTAVRLSLVDLERSTTITPYSHPCKEASQHLKQVTAELRHGLEQDALREEPINVSESPSGLQYLGEHKDMPFYMVQAGKDLFNASKPLRESREVLNTATSGLLPDKRGSSESAESYSSLTTLDAVSEICYEDEVSLVRRRSISRESSGQVMTSALRAAVQPGLEPSHSENSIIFAKRSKTNTQDYAGCQRSHLQLRSSFPNALTSHRASFQPSMEPQALCLTISLSNSSFVTKKRSKTKGSIVLDVKIDVFFNGELCASTYVPERYRGEVNNFSELTQRFTGRRIARLQERPWVIVPPGQSANGNLKEHKRSSGAYGGGSQRWSALSEILLAEANNSGRNKYGELSILGRYLKSLSELEMPPNVKNLQKPDGPKFGVIDVVLTTGKGQKDFSNCPYVAAPTRMRTNEYKPRNQSESKAEAPLEDHQRTSISSNLSTSSLLGQHAPAAKISRDCSRPTRNGRLPAAVAALTPTPSISTPVQNVPKHNPVRTAAEDKLIFSSVRARFPRNSTGRVFTDTLIEHSRKKASTGSTSLPHKTANGRTATSWSSNPGADIRVEKNVAAPRISAVGVNTQRRGRRSTKLQLRPSLGDVVSGRERLSINARARPRSLMGYFLKSSTPGQKVVPKPSEIVQAIPQEVPQKRYKSADSIPDAEAKPKRSRLEYHVVVDAKMTLLEEINSIEEVAREQYAIDANRVSKGGFPLTRTRLANMDSTPPPVITTASTTSLGETLSKIVRLKLAQPQAPKVEELVASAALASGSKLRKLVPYPDSTPSRSLSPPHLEAENIKAHDDISSSAPHPLSSEPVPLTSTSHPNTSRATTSIHPVSNTLSPPPEPQSTKRFRSGMRGSSAKAFGAGAKSKPKRKSKLSATNSIQAPPPYETPPLSNDCAITYKDGSVRQVRAERNGWFEEVGILMGVRFLIG
ncbi:hypothetical protein MMC06_004113 [Schaereria dolodes]|nr:hypothetical protein [Schaereria dolodes]